MLLRPPLYSPLPCAPPPTCSTPAALHFFRKQPSLVFTARCYGDSSYRHWCCGLGIGYGTGTLYFSKWTSSAEISLPILNCHTMDVGPAPSASLPLLPDLTCLLPYILSYRTSIQLVFCWFSMILTP